MFPGWRPRSRPVANWSDDGGTTFGSPERCGSSGPTDGNSRAVGEGHRHKSPCEQGLLRRASEILAGTLTRLRKEVAEGIGARSAAIAAEDEAYTLGAQDARVYASIRNGGSPLPFDTAADPMPAPLLASVAVRYAGYWAAGHVTLNSSSPQLQRAETALRRSSTTHRGVQQRHCLKWRTGLLPFTGAIPRSGW